MLHSTLPRRAGIGFKHLHLQALLAGPTEIGFVEVHAENYMVDGGPLHRGLARVRERHPLALHGVGLSIGGEAPPDEDHLDRLHALIRRYQPAVFSEHLAWSSHGGVYFNDLLPLPYNVATLSRVVEHIDRVQSRLKCRLLLENPATYLAFDASTMDEADFLCELLRRSGCGLLLDINNAHVSAVNHGREAAPFLDALLDGLPPGVVGQIHLAGFTPEPDVGGAPLLIDSHGTPVDAAVWALYARVLARLGPVPTLIERDNDLPPLPVLLAEAAQAGALLRASQQGETAAAPAAMPIAAACVEGLP